MGELRKFLREDLNTTVLAGAIGSLPRSSLANQHIHPLAAGTPAPFSGRFSLADSRCFGRKSLSSYSHCLCAAPCSTRPTISEMQGPLPLDGTHLAAIYDPEVLWNQAK